MIAVYYFTRYLQPIVSSMKMIQEEDYGTAVLSGMYAIEDTQKKPQPKRYERQVWRDAWQDSPVQRLARTHESDAAWIVEHDGATIFNVDCQTRLEIFRSTITAEQQRTYRLTLFGEIG